MIVSIYLWILCFGELLIISKSCKSVEIIDETIDQLRLDTDAVNKGLNNRYLIADLARADTHGRGGSKKLQRIGKPTEYVSPPLSDTNKPRLCWIFLLYHKTGTFLARSIAQTYEESCKVSNFSFSRQINEMEISTQTMKSCDLTIFDNPTDLNPHWLDSFDNDINHYRIVHFVRNPFELVLSAYLYHSIQPAVEKFVTDKKYKFCSRYDLTKIASHINAYLPNEDIKEMLLTAHRKCVFVRMNFPYHFSLQQMYNLSIHKANINNTGPVDLFPAIKLEAYHSIFKQFLLVMAFHSLHNPSDYHMKHVAVKKVFLRDFDLTNRSVFRTSLSNVMRFLYSPFEAHALPCKGCECLPRSETSLDTLLTHAFVSDKPNRSESQRVHVTRDKLSESDKQRYIQRLRRDEDVGPLLSLLERILNR